MNGRHVDGLLRALASPRRSLLGGGAATLVAWLGIADAVAKKKKKRKKRKKKKCKGRKKKCGKRCISAALCCTNNECGTGNLCVEGQCISGLGACLIGADICEGTGGGDCGATGLACTCVTATNGQTRCASNSFPASVCGDCAEDSSCASFGLGAFCAQGGPGGSENCCVLGDGICVLPCPA